MYRSVIELCGKFRELAAENDQKAALNGVTDHELGRQSSCPADQQGWIAAGAMLGYSDCADDLGSLCRHSRQRLATALSLRLASWRNRERTLRFGVDDGAVDLQGRCIMKGTRAALLQCCQEAATLLQQSQSQPWSSLLHEQGGEHLHAIEACLDRLFHAGENPEAVAGMRAIAARAATRLTIALQCECDALERNEADPTGARVSGIIEVLREDLKAMSASTAELARVGTIADTGKMVDTLNEKLAAVAALIYEPSTI